MAVSKNHVQNTTNAPNKPKRKQNKKKDIQTHTLYIYDVKWFCRFSVIVVMVVVIVVVVLNGAQLFDMEFWVIYHLPNLCGIVCVLRRKSNVLVRYEPGWEGERRRSVYYSFFTFYINAYFFRRPYSLQTITTITQLNKLEEENRKVRKAYSTENGIRVCKSNCVWWRATMAMAKEEKNRMNERMN